MTIENNSDNRQIVLSYLEQLLEETPQDERQVKIYHVGRGSYTLPEMTSEVKLGTQMGNEYVRTIAEAARKEKQTVREYLKIQS